MLSPKSHIRQYILQALAQMGCPEPDHIAIECPDNPEFGHYASPIAMTLARTLKKSPRDIATQLIPFLQHEDFDRVEVAGAGYINFFLSDTLLSRYLEHVLSMETVGMNNLLKEKSFHVEYVSANPTGPLHIGHGRWAAVGDTLARFLNHCGGKVYREFYVNDAGVQIKNLNASIKAVAEGKPVPEDGYHGAYIKDLAEKSLQKGVAPEIIMQKEQEDSLRAFRVEFDCWFSEKKVHADGSLESSLETLKKIGAAYEQDGALWFKSTDYGDDKDRVLIKSDGSYTYFAADIAYHYDKIKRGNTQLIDILGADHHGYIERIKAAVHLFGGELTVLLGQLVNLFRDGEPVRMSKRTGDIITLDEVVDEIGVDAVRYLLVRRPMTATVDFDLAKAKSQNDDNPVFYVQYAHARICSILRNSQKSPVMSGFVDNQERLLLIELLKFEDVLAEVAFDYDLQKIPAYLETLAGAYHRFYRQCRIIDDSNEALRLALCKAAGKTLEAGLNILGVSAPQVMN
ncbi:MAG: arginine--tRNA ligase [Brevinema sp.]